MYFYLFTFHFLCFVFNLPFLEAQTTANQTISYQIAAINSISVSGNPGALNITTATAGSNPTSITDTSTTYSITTNQTTQRITALLNTAMPTGTTLKITLSVPTGATTGGTISLSTTAQALVTNISSINQSNLTINYNFTATPSAGTISTTSRIVTFTFGP